MSAQSNLVVPALFSDSRSSSTTDVSSIQDVKDEKAQVDVESRSVRNDGSDSEKEEMEDPTLVSAFNLPCWLVQVLTAVEGYLGWP